MGVVALSLALGVGATACGSARAGDVDAGTDSRFGHAAKGDLAISDAWATEAPAAPKSGSGATDMGSTMASVSGAYFTITNDSGDDDALVGASTPYATEAQLHTTESTSGGTAGTMKEVARIPVPNGRTTTLTVGGYHVMLVRPTRSLTIGVKVPLTLRFASGTTVKVQVPVIDRADRPR